MCVCAGLSLWVLGYFLLLLRNFAYVMLLFRSLLDMVGAKYIEMLLYCATQTTKCDFACAYVVWSNQQISQEIPSHLYPTIRLARFDR